MFYNLQLIIIFLAHSLVIGDSSDKEDHIYLAKLAEQAKRYNDMVSEMKTVVKLNLDSDLTVEERNLLFVAYNNVIGVRQDSWKIVRSIGQKEELKQAHPNTKLLLIKTYREKIEEEMKYICDDGLTILDQILIPNASTGESQVFYYKMKGDFYKYLAEITTGTLRSSSADNALIAYNSALDIAMTELPSTHPIRLGLALNFSVFYYEILNSLERACRMAKNAFDGAIAELDTLSEESYKLSTSIMQQLRDNLTLWLCNMQGSNEDGGEQRADQEQD